MKELLGEVKHLLRRYHLKPSRRLGQSFVVDRGLIDRMISYAEVGRQDTVLEIGAGLGTLTKALASVAKRVLAVEVDPKLVRVLQEQLAALGNVQILAGDFLKLELPSFDKVVSNPPYSISSPILFRLLGAKFEVAVMTFQRELAERLIAKPGTANYGRLTVMAHALADIRLLERVPKTAFYPEPEVESAVTLIKPRQAPFEILEWRLFSDVVRILFTQRMRKLRKALKVLGRELRVPADQLTSSLAHLMDKRIYQLEPWEFASLVNAISRLRSEASS